MKILIIGGSGFVGSKVVERLFQDNHELTLLVHKKNTNAKLKTVIGDVLDQKSLSAAMKNMDAIVNLVGIIREKPPVITFDNMHVVAVKNILHAMKENNLNRLIHISAFGAKKRSKSKYFETKFQAEEFIKKSGVDFTILRPSIIWAENGGFHDELENLANYPFFIPIVGNGKQPFNLVKLSNLAEVVSKILEEERTVGKIFDIGGPKIFTFEEMITMVENNIGKKKIHINVPFFIVNLITKIMESVRINFPVTSTQLMMLSEGNVAKDNSIFDIVNVRQEEI